MTIALLLGMLTIPAAACPTGGMFDPDKAAEHNKNAVKAAAYAPWGATKATINYDYVEGATA